MDKINNICRTLDSRKADYQLYITEAPGHAVKLARKHGEQADTAVIAAGGDGTCNEVINGLMSITGRDYTPILGAIPIGRGNDFCFGAGIPSFPEEAVLRMLEEKTLKFDIGKVSGGDYPEGRWFGNGIGVGFDAVVGFEAAKMKHVHGAMAYTLGALKTLAIYPEAPQIEFTVNGTVSHIRPALISVMNGRRMGGSFFMAPDGDPTDGRLNWCHTKQEARLKLLAAMKAYTRGTQAERDDTEAGHGSTIHIRALKGTLAVHADGETICENGKELEVSIRPGALRLIGSSLI
jgi:YegS/Rv2252/BmrU family lipid kinase